MNPFIIYAIIVGGAFAALFLQHAMGLSSTLLRSRLAKKAFKHLAWSVIVSRTRCTPPITRGDVVAQLLYWGGTLLVNVFQVRSLPEAASRAGSIAILYLIPLVAGGRLSFAADWMGLSLRTFQYLHNTFGLMVSAQLISHVVLVFRTGGLRPLELKDRYGIIVRIINTNTDRLTVNRRAARSSPLQWWQSPSHAGSPTRCFYGSMGACLF
jgi:hypothetical protein